MHGTALQQQGLRLLVTWFKVQLANVPSLLNSEMAWCSGDDADLSGHAVATGSWLCQSPATAGMARHGSMESQKADS